ncbi:MAG: tetratricopeptide repeat protein [Lysobacterales bacterium]|jgi:TolB-like protein
MNGIKNLFHELRRRRVFRMTAVYIIASWVMLQVADLLFPALGIDEIALRYVWIALALGFPLAVLFSWRYDIGADGITRTLKAGDADAASMALRKSDYFILLVLLAIAVFTVFTMTQRVVEEQAAINIAPHTRDIDPHSIAVLPLDNLSPEPAQAYFATGMYDSLINSLSKVHALQVTSRTSASRVDTSLGIPEIGRKLGVANVIEGSVFREGNRVRITVNLIDTASDQYLWTETYERDFDDVMAIQASMARSVARAIEATLSVEDEQRLARSLTIRPETFEAYLRAIFSFRSETQEGYLKGIEILEEALANDPTSALAHAALGQGYSELLHGAMPVGEATRRARAATEKALELDPTLAEAHLAMGLYRLYGEGDWKGSEEHFRRAIELNPSMADAWYHWAWWLEIGGVDDEAIVAGEKAVELSPLSSYYISWLADQYRDAGDYDKAIELAESVIDLDPDYPVALYALGNAYLEQERYAEAIATHQKIAHSPRWAAALGHTYAWAGQPDKALAIAQSYEHTPANALPLAKIYAALGDSDQAVYWMEQLRDTGNPMYLAMFGWSAATRSLHEDPRIQAMADEAGLPLVPYPKD